MKVYFYEGTFLQIYLTKILYVHDVTGNAIRRPISPVDVLEGVEAVISCLEAVLENEDHSDPDS